MLIEMTIKGLTVDPVTNMPIVILHDEHDQRVLPIWVGVFEANAIALQIENVHTPRPMTHDLLRNVIHDLQATRRAGRRLRREGQHLLRARSISTRRRGSVAVDARPSDAIALALRTRAPILVEEHVIDNAKTIDVAHDEGRRRAAPAVAREPRPGRPRQVQDVASAGRCARGRSRRRKCRPADNFPYLSHLQQLTRANLPKPTGDPRHRALDGVQTRLLE